MSIDNTLPTYQSLALILHQQAVALTPAEMHGLVSGMLCGGSKDNHWQTLVYELTNEGEAFPQALLLPLRQLYDATQEALANEGFMFQMLLPEGDDVSIFTRVDELSGWVNHFLLGLGLLQPKLAQITGDVGEAISDLRNIAQLGYDEDEDQEELAQSLEEVAEYVRMAAILCHVEFTHNPSSVPEMRKPTLH